MSEFPPEMVKGVESKLDADPEIKIMHPGAGEHCRHYRYGNSVQRVAELQQCDGERVDGEVLKIYLNTCYSKRPFALIYVGRTGSYWNCVPDIVEYLVDKIASETPYVVTYSDFDEVQEAIDERRRKTEDES